MRGLTTPEALDLFMDGLLREFPKLKESLGIIVELAAPDLFIPQLPGW